MMILFRGFPIQILVIVRVGVVWQVLAAAEEALRRLQVSGAERNAILDTLRYLDHLAALRAASAGEEAAASDCDAATAAALARQHSTATSTSEPSESKPFTRCKQGTPHCFNHPGRQSL